MSTPPYRIASSTMTPPSRIALAKRYERVEDAIADMGTGIVVDREGELVAFHGCHSRFVPAYEAAQTEKRKAR